MTFSYSRSVTEISGHRYFTITILTFLKSRDIQMATRVAVVVELDFLHSKARSSNLPLDAMISQISLAEAQL